MAWGGRATELLSRLDIQTVPYFPRWVTEEPKGPPVRPVCTFTPQPPQ